MSTAKIPQHIIDARFRAKLDARHAGTTPVLVEVPEIATPEDLDSRFREKLSRHRQVSRQPAAKTEKPAQETVKAEPRADHLEENQPQQQRHDRDERRRGR